MVGARHEVDVSHAEETTSTRMTQMSMAAGTKERPLIFLTADRQTETTSMQAAHVDENTSISMCHRFAWVFGSRSLSQGLLDVSSTFLSGRPLRGLMASL